MAASKQKSWLENGAEQTELNRLFEANKFDDSTLPNKVRLSSEAFMAFPAKTFAAHFRKTKAKYGAYGNFFACVLPLRQLILVFSTANNRAEQGEGSIPELTGSTILSKKRNIEEEDNKDVSEEPPITFTNPPLMTWVHYDIVEKVDIVSVALPVISGSENVDFVLSDDGMKLIVNYTWPTLIIVPRVLFCRRAQTMPLSHPRINSMSAELIKREISEKKKPVGSIIIRLPMKVQREVGTWEYEGIRMNGTDAILFQFKAYQAKTVIEDAVTRVNFL